MAQSKPYALQAAQQAPQAGAQAASAQPGGRVGAAQAATAMPGGSSSEGAPALAAQDPRRAVRLTDWASI
ncbi:MAG: hypothetical protein ACXIU8_09465 [Alkalilacustris sp.]